MGYAETNAFARSICGLPPSYHADMRTIDAHRPPLIKQGGTYRERTSFRGDTSDITFMGFDLVVETDYMGYVECVMNAKDGTDCMCMFAPWALAEIKTLAHAEQLARSAE